MSSPPIDSILEEFLAECRAGTAPSIADYQRRYPDRAGDIRELFPTVLLLETGNRNDALPDDSLSYSSLSSETKNAIPKRIENYRILREIGRGGMGIVYEADDETLGRRVALKVLRQFSENGDQAVRRFRREAQMAARLHHTNIVPVFRTGVFDGRLFYVMQAIEGIGIDRFLSFFRLRDETAATISLPNESAVTRIQSPDDFIPIPTIRLTDAPTAVTTRPEMESPPNSSLAPKQEISPVAPNVAPIVVPSVAPNVAPSISHAPSASVASAKGSGGKTNRRHRKAANSFESQKTDVTPPGVPPLTVSSPKTAEVPAATTDEKEGESQSPIQKRSPEDDGSSGKIEFFGSEDAHRCREVIRRFINGGFGDSVQYRTGDGTTFPPIKTDFVHLSSRTITNDRRSFSLWCRSVCGVGIQVAQALEYAHRHEILHRDIKPSNLLLDESGVVWITDFGLARPFHETDITKSGQIIGTLRYLAPESVEGEFSPQSDIYSLGLTLYELLTFVPAMSETSYTALLAQIGQGEIEPPRKINRAIPRDLETIIFKAVEKNPARRYQSGSEMADDLRRFMEERPIKARRTSVFGHFFRWCRRNRLSAALTIFSTLLLVILAFGSTIAFLAEYSLLYDKEIESNRAERNLQLALSAFDDIFVQFGNPVRTLNLPDEASTLFFTVDSAPINEREIQILESLLVFYDRFAAENADDEKLLLETARAYEEMGKIRQRLGRTEEALAAYEKSLNYYQQTMRLADHPFPILLEQAAVVRRLAPRLSTHTALDDLYRKALDKSILDLTNYPATMMEQSRKDQELANLLFFRVLTKTVDYPTTISTESTAENLPPVVGSVAEIEKDFGETRRLLTALDDSWRFKDSPTIKAETALLDAAESIWRIKRGEREEAIKLRDRAANTARELDKQWPCNTEVQLSRLKILVLLVFNIRFDPQSGTEDEVPHINDALKTSRLLHEHFPKIPSYLVFFIMAEHAIGNQWLQQGRLDKADEWFGRMVKGIAEFRKDFPNYDDFQIFAKPRLDITWLRIRQGRLAEAKETLDLIDRESPGRLLGDPLEMINWNVEVERARRELQTRSSEKEGVGAIEKRPENVENKEKDSAKN